MNTTERFILCPTSDDVIALRALLSGVGAQERLAPGKPRQATRATFTRESDKVQVEVEVTNGKALLATQALYVAQGSAATRPVKVLVCFSPSSDGFQFFKTDFEASRQRLGAGKLEERAPDRFSFVMNKREIEILAAPWSSTDVAPFADIPEEQSLERLLLSGLLRATNQSPRVYAWADEATKSLRQIVETHGHNRALRIWSAAMFRGQTSFVEQLLTDTQTKDSCLAALVTSQAGQAVTALLA